MGHNLDNWAITRITKQFRKKLDWVPVYEVMPESFWESNRSSIDLSETEHHILMNHFSVLGVVQKQNHPPGATHSSLQKIYLSPQRETMCCLGHLSIVGDKIPYLELISEYDTGVIIFTAIHQDILQRYSRKRSPHKIQTIFSRESLVIGEMYHSHIKTVNQYKKQNRLKTFTKIEDIIEISRRLYLGDLYERSMRMCQTMDNLKWPYKKILSDHGYSQLKKEMADLTSQIKAHD